MPETPASHLRRRRLPLGLIATLGLGALVTLTAAGCGDDPEDEGRGTRLDAPAVIFEAGAEADPTASCPPSPPRVGENCIGVTETRVTCTFVVGICQQPTTTYDITVDYCCNRGSTWDQCGTNTTPCDNEPPPEPDAATGQGTDVDAGAGD